MTIKQLRIERGLTQKELAAACGTSQIQISRWEAGQVQPSSTSLRKLAAALHCTMDEIDPSARKVRASDIFNEDDMVCLTADERRRILKREQALQFTDRPISSGIEAMIPDEWWNVYSAQHIGEMLNLLSKAFADGVAYELAEIKELSVSP